MIVSNHTAFTKDGIMEVIYDAITLFLENDQELHVEPARVDHILESIVLRSNNRAFTISKKDIKVSYS